MQQKFIYLEKLIAKAGRIFLTVHPDHDLDALASLTGMADFLSHRNKSFFAHLHEPFRSANYFFPHLDKINTNQGNLDKHFNSADLILILDCPNKQRAGLGHLNLLPQHTKVIIDHHISLPHNARLAISVPQISSTSQIISSFLKYVGHPLSKPVATGLLAGILADTGIFTNSATSAGAVYQSADLIKQGADYNFLIKQVFGRKQLNQLKQFGHLLQRVKLDRPNKRAFLVITNQDFKNSKLTEEALNGLPNFLQQNLKGVEQILILKEKEKGQIKGALRSTTKPVLSLARLLGGGGHPMSAGFKIEGYLKQVGNAYQVM